MTDDVGPRRLKDDPDFRWETGCDLSAEEEVVGSFDHDTMRARLVAAVVAGAPPAAPPPSSPAGSPWWAIAKPAMGLIAIVGALGTAYVAGLHAGSGNNPPDPAEARIPAAAAVPTPITVVAPAPEPSAAPVEPQALVAPPVVAPAPAPSLVVRPSPAPVPAEAGHELEPLTAVDPPTLPQKAPPTEVILAAPSRSTMGPQLAQYDLALEQLQRGENAAARDSFRLYLATWPDGDLRPEAQIGLLQSLHGTGDAEAAATLAAKLQDLPDLVDRRSNILRLRAESLVVLGRCDEAATVAADLPSRDQADIRRACRSMRREGQ